jgi:hypothetical protein
MADDGPGKRISPKVWLACRTAYVVTGWTYEKCAKEFGIAAATIRRKGSAEGWAAERRRNLTSASDAVASDLLASTKEALAMHASLPDRIAEEIDKGLSELDNMPPGRSKAETIRVYAEAADRVVRLARLVRGYKDGESSTDEEEEKGLIIEQRRVEPKMIPVDAGGRVLES